MSTITFDAHDLVIRLHTAGFSEQQAEAVVKVIADAHGDLVTKDSQILELAPMRTDLSVMKWMLGVLLAGVLSLVLKAFF